MLSTIKFKNKFKLYILISLFVVFLYNKRKDESNIKVCLCTIGKFENNYIREYIEHYKKYGVDKIFLYDNNDKNGEKFDYIISDYLKNGFVQIVNFRGVKLAQNLAYDSCYQSNFKIYNWLIFYDIDEFINLNNMNIKQYLSKKIFNKCQSIQLNWVMHTDNNYLYYKNESLFKRFPKRGKSLKNIFDVKSIIRGNISIKIDSAHFGNFKLISCDAFGKIKNDFRIKKNYYYHKFFIDHFFSKSTEELIIKIKRGSVASLKSRINYLINSYFYINEITEDKLNYIEKQLSFNISEYKKNLTKNFKI